MVRGTSQKVEKIEKKAVYFLVKLLVLELIVVVLSGQKKVSFFDYFGIYESKLSFNLGKHMFFCPKNTIIWQFLLAKHFFRFLKNATWEVDRSLWCEKNIKNAFFEKKLQFSRLFWHLRWTAAFQKHEKGVFSAILARFLRSVNLQKVYPPSVELGGGLFSFHVLKFTFSDFPENVNFKT